MTRCAFIFVHAGRARELNEEEQRHIREGLTEEELAIFDILVRPDLNDADERKVKQVSRTLINKLKAERLILDWKKRQNTRAAFWINKRAPGRQCFQQ